MDSFIQKYPNITLNFGGIYIGGLDIVCYNGYEILVKENKICQMKIKKF